MLLYAIILENIYIFDQIQVSNTNTGLFKGQTKILKIKISEYKYVFDAILVTLHISFELYTALL